MTCREWAIVLHGMLLILLWMLQDDIYTCFSVYISTMAIFLSYVNKSVLLKSLQRPSQHVLLLFYLLEEYHCLHNRIHVYVVAFAQCHLLQKKTLVSNLFLSLYFIYGDFCTFVHYSFTSYLGPVQDPYYLFHLDNVPVKKIMETLGLN